MYAAARRRARRAAPAVRATADDATDDALYDMLHGVGRRVARRIADDGASADEQPGGEQPADEQPGGSQPGGEQPDGEQPGGSPPGDAPPADGRQARWRTPTVDEMLPILYTRRFDQSTAVVRGREINIDSWVYRQYRAIYIGNAPVGTEALVFAVRTMRALRNQSRWIATLDHALAVHPMVRGLMPYYRGSWLNLQCTVWRNGMLPQPLVDALVVRGVPRTPAPPSSLQCRRYDMASAVDRARPTPLSQLWLDTYTAVEAHTRPLSFDDCSLRQKWFKMPTHAMHKWVYEMRSWYRWRTDSARPLNNAEKHRIRLVEQLNAWRW